jgi:glycosyltransferase involved in cell wall biosynthesis
LFELSIITINFNNLSGLKKTFKSIIPNQSRDLEYIVIDADSTDGSKDLIQLNKDQIDCLIIEKDNGIYDAMNKGIRLAKGKYCIFINSGDEILDLKGLLNDIKSGVIFQDLIYGDTEIQYTNGFNRVASSESIDELWKGLPCVHQSLMVKTTFHRNHLFDLNYKFCSDYELVCRMQKSGASIFKRASIVSRIEAGGLSDEKRIEATNEVEQISNTYFNLSESQQTFFKNRNKKGGMALKLKKILPPFIVKFALKMKYRK